MSTSMEYLTREQILKADDIQFEDVDVPEWGGKVLVRGMTGTERDAFEEAIIEQRGKKSRILLQNLRAKLVSRSLVDPADRTKRLFDEGDVRALGRKSTAALQRVFNVAQRLSGISDEDIEELTKNSDDGQSGSSTSG